jgi:hypothetical protein
MMNRKPYTSLCSFSLCTAILLLLLSASAAFCAPAERFKFTFNPPDGLTGTETHKTTQVMNLGQGMIRTQVYGGKAAISFTRSQGRYLVSRTPVSFEYVVDGRKLDSQGELTRIVNLIGQAPITYQLDEGGDCTRVYGIDEFIKLLERRTPQGVSQQAVASLRNCQDVLTTQAINEWNEMIAPFTYRTARVGDVWKTTLDRPMPGGGTIMVAAKVSFLGWVNSGGRRWIKVRVDNGCSDTAAMQRYLTRMYSQMALTDAQRAQLPTFTGMSVKSSDVRLIDPSTMLYLRQTVSQEIKVTASLKGLGKRSIAIKQGMQRSFTYSSQAVASR